MAPPNPPPTTHQTPAAAAPKRHHHKRHAPLQPPVPEESSSPAMARRVDGLVQPPEENLTPLPPAGSTINPAPLGGELMDGQALEMSGRKAKKQGRSSKLKRPPLPADLAVTGKQLQPSVTTNSGDLGVIGRQIRIEGGVGFAGLLPDSALTAMPGNATPRSSADFQSADAPKVFDLMPESTSSLIPEIVVPTEDGESWERGPETVFREGSTVRAIFQSSSAGSPLFQPDTGRPELLLQSSSNAGYTQRSGTSGGTLDAVDTRKEGSGGGNLAPGRVGGTGDLAASSRRVLQAAREADSGHLTGGRIVHSRGFEASIQGLLQADHAGYTTAGAGGKERNGNGSSKRSNSAENWADCTVPGTVCPDFAHVTNATDFAVLGESSRGQGGMEGGQMGSISSNVPRGEVLGVHNAGILKEATLLRQPAATPAELSCYGRGHGTRDTCALHNARLSCDTLVDFWSALSDDTRLSFLRMKEENFIENLMHRYSEACQELGLD